MTKCQEEPRPLIFYLHLEVGTPVSSTHSLLFGKRGAHVVTQKLRP